MSKNRMESNEYPQIKLNVQDLKRRGIHEGKPLYPTDELEIEDFEESPVKNRSPQKNLSETESDSSPKNKVKFRGQKQSDSECSPPKTKEEPQIKAESSIWKWLLSIVGLSIVVVVLVYLFSRQSPPPGTKPLDIEKVMSNMRQRFTGQPDLTFRVVRTAIRTATGESLSPGIIILLASKEAKEISKQFALHLAESISPSNYISVKSKSFRTPEELKKDIDVTISSNLTEDTLKAVLVDDIDGIPYEAAVIFHSFCDHENAPFKKAIYVMTMSSEEKIPPKSETKTWDSLALKRLKDVWKNSGEDQVSSLISRITVSVAAIIGKT